MYMLIDSIGIKELIHNLCGGQFYIIVGVKILSWWVICKSCAILYEGLRHKLTNSKVKYTYHYIWLKPDVKSTFD
jgi:hypothetical protein